MCHPAIRARGALAWLRVNNLVADTSVELECIEAHHVHEGMSSSILNEWKGTKLKWEIRKHNGTTRIALVHEGLVSSPNCYEICEQGWNTFFANSLKQYLDTGQGAPFENHL